MRYFLSVFRTRLQNPKYWSAAVVGCPICGLTPGPLWDHSSLLFYTEQAIFSTLGKPYFLCWALSIFFKSQVFVLEMHNKHVVFSNKGTYYTNSLIIFPHLLHKECSCTATIGLTRTVQYIFSSNSVVYMGWPSNQKCPTFPIVRSKWTSGTLTI